MPVDVSELDEMQNTYKAAVEEWIAAIRQEEALASGDHSVAQVDQWEAAGFREEEARDKVKAAKEAYEDALREKFSVSRWVQISQRRLTSRTAGPSTPFG